MDFPNRDAQQQSKSAAPATNSAAVRANNFSHGGGGKSKRRREGSELWRLITVLVVAAVAILIVAVIVVIIAGSNSVKAEDKYIDTNKLQAVFLNTGQVYFGHVQSLNDKYFVVTDIYYLQTTNSGTSASSSSSASNVTLVKLGCELHRPYDQMVINSDQVTFWENLQSDGQVAKAVAAFQQQNPNGQKCADQSSSASPSSGSSTQNAPSTSTPASSTKKP